MDLQKKNLNDLPWQEHEHGGAYHAYRKRLTPHDGTKPKIGASYFRLLPGKRAFPRHEHLANDEAILVIKGSAELSYGDQRIALREGDYVHLAAASGVAHQMINNGDSDLEYLCISSMIEPDIGLYPDSGKIGVFTGSAPGGDPALRRLDLILKIDDRPYWEGE